MNKLGKLKILVYAGILGLSVPLYAQDATKATETKTDTDKNELSSWKGAGKTGGRIFIEWDHGYVEQSKSGNADIKWNEYGYGKGKISIDQDGYYVFVNTGERDVGGINQQVYLNQKGPKPIYVSAESKAENVAGTEPSNYSIYLDIYYSDGTSSLAVVAPFKPGTHDWETASLTFTPKKPIKSVIYYLLLRYQTGKVWFRNAVLKE
jgi:hypothetical protein